MYVSTFPYTLQIQGKLMKLETPKVMGIMNVTPDSFYGKSRCRNREAIRQRAMEMVTQGVDILDIGACSTRPGSTPPSEKEELERILPALEIIREVCPELPISVDTYRAVVAEKTVADFKVGMINDISGGDMDPKMFEVAAKCQVPYILTHIQGDPLQMQQNPHYDNITVDVCRYFSEKMAQLRAMGLNDIVIDPGFGFGKTIGQNYELMRHLPDLFVLQAPMLVGVSRKSMIYKLLDTTPEEALNGTTAVNMLALAGGAHILRVHDVKEAVECVKIYQSYKGTKSC